MSDESQSHIETQIFCWAPPPVEGVTVHRKVRAVAEEYLVVLFVLWF